MQLSYLRHIKGIEVRQDESFGVIPLRKGQKHWEVFLIQHNRSGYWGFPKGHAEEGETPQEAAFRELKEETNLELVHLLQKEPLMEQYTFMMDGLRVFKRVSYFIAEVILAVPLNIPAYKPFGCNRLVNGLDHFPGNCHNLHLHLQRLKRAIVGKPELGITDKRIGVIKHI